MAIMNLLGKATGLSAIFALTTSFITPPPPPAPIERYRSLVDKIPDSVPAISSDRPSLKQEINTSYKYLRDRCPAMAKVDISSPWNLASWMDKKITPEEWAAAPYSFTMNSFRAVSVQKNSQIKLEMLGKLYTALPSHPAFMVWVDDRMEIFNADFNKDALVKRAAKRWLHIAKSDKRLKEYSSYVGEMLIESFLPGSDIKMPDIYIKRENVGYLGQYQPASNNVYFNYSGKKTGIKDFDEANRVIVHEYFHLLEEAIQSWSLSGKLDNNPALKEMGEKFYYSGNPYLAYVSDATDVNIYKNTFKERWSYHVMRATSKPGQMILQTRYPGWIDKHPLTADNRHPETGRLPAACFKIK